ncbi:MAG: AMIN domain-containing protein [Elusimicrobia bacterium]|nr:AMIN domain-containing protein [Elusimicrobiota bacterium]
MSLIKILAVLMLSVSSLFAQNRVEEFDGVSVEFTEDSAEILLSLSGSVKYHNFRVSDPPRLVVEMINALNKWEGTDSDYSHFLVKTIRSGQYKSDPVKITRLVIDLNTEDYKFEDVFEENTIKINLSLTEEAAALRLERIAELEKEKLALEKKKEAKKPSLPPIKPNIPSEEHLKTVEAIKSQVAEREDKLSRLSPEDKKAESGQAVIGSLVGSLSDEIVDFNFVDAEIREVLRSFAHKLEKNIIPAEDVSGLITLRLKNISFDEAFSMLLDRKDLVAIQRSPNVIEVLRREMMPTERRTFNLKSRSAEDIKDTLDSLMTSDEKANTTLAVDNASNSLIITATPEVLGKIESLVKQMDIKSPQIKIKTRIIEVQAGDAFESAMSWAANVPFTNDGVKQIRGVKDVSNYKIDSANQSFDFSGAITQPSFMHGGILDISAVIDNTTLYGILNLLSTKTKSKTVSEPTIMTENNKSASIHVGRNLPVRTTRVTETGTTQSVEFISEGVTLDVTPIVSPGSDQIALNVDVSLTDFVGFQADSPITQGRSAKTEVTVESGKTIIIGGLIKETDIESDSGIPILKDIPLLGYLFKSKNQTVERTELLVFLSPEIVED